MLRANLRPTWWQRLRARRRVAAGPDAADMGTTFGLEMSLSAAADEPPRAAARVRRRPWWTRRATGG